MNGVGDGDSPMEVYLDGLVTQMPARRPREFRRLLAEAEAHLRDDAEQLLAQGLSEREAERQAVSRFGTVRNLVSDDRPRLAPLRDVGRQVVVTGLLLGGTGAVAVGLSGLIAGLFRVFIGSSFLVDVPPHQTLSATDCARWLALQPGIASCHDAAIADWANETVAYRIAAGLVGAILLLVCVVVRRRIPGDRRYGLPRAISNAIAVTAFAGGALWTLALSLQAVITSDGHGSGQWLSAALVAVAGAIAFGLRLISDIRYSEAKMVTVSPE